MFTIVRRSTKTAPKKHPSPEERLINALHTMHADFAVSHKMFIAFVQGICYGLGFITAVAVIIPVILYALRSVDFPPIIATFVEDVVEQMERQ